MTVRAFDLPVARRVVPVTVDEDGNRTRRDPDATTTPAAASSSSDQGGGPEPAEMTLLDELRARISRYVRVDVDDDDDSDDNVNN